MEGSVSGPQEALAYENVRYVSDAGEISLFIRSGSQTTSDRDNFRFFIDDGISPVPVGQLPGAPVSFLSATAREVGPWQVSADTVIAVVPAAGDDRVTASQPGRYGSGGVAVG